MISNFWRDLKFVIIHLYRRKHRRARGRYQRRAALRWYFKCAAMDNFPDVINMLPKDGSDGRTNAVYHYVNRLHRMDIGDLFTRLIHHVGTTGTLPNAQYFLNEANPTLASTNV